ncbi:MAG: putative nucleotide-diphospho-sugar transferase [Thermodesulfobacteriota bacterium]
MSFKIITAADSNYYKFLKNFEDNILKNFNQYPVVYDLGLTQKEIVSLKSEIRKVPIGQEYARYDSRGNIKATHKPLCILDCLKAYKKHDCLYVDADILFTQHISLKYFMDSDIAVAHRHPKEQTERHYPNGLINTGLIYFRNTNQVNKFIHTWYSGCSNDDTTDQIELSNILLSEINLVQSSNTHKSKTGELQIYILDPQIYNDCSLSTGKILHFKNAGRSEKAFKTYKFYYSLIKERHFLIKVYMLARRINQKIKNYTSLILNIFVAQTASNQK